MSEEDPSQKTEDPTERKLADAKKKGQVAQSQEVKSWMILLGGLAGLIIMAPFMASNVFNAALPFIESPHAMAANYAGMQPLLAKLAGQVGLLLAPLMTLLFLISIFSNIAQFGLIFAPEKIKFDISKISLLKGVKRMFSSRSVMEFLKGILKLLAVGLVSLAMALPMLEDLTLIPFMELSQTLDRIHIIAILLTVGTVIVMTVISLIDFIYQKYAFTKKMKMSKQEVKDEHKQTEGDPQIKARIRKLRMDRAQQRMMAAVPEADVVITNPTHYSIALKYKIEEMPAPKVVAKGVDHLAFRIREVAKEHDIPLVENPPLARALYASVELNEEIPPEHFKAVAEVIGFVMRRRGDLPAQDQPAQENLSDQGEPQVQ